MVNRLVLWWFRIVIKNMKKEAFFQIGIMVLLLFMFADFGLCENEAKYTGLASIPFHLRLKPDGYRITDVPKGGRIEILEWTDDWCLAVYKGTVGYCKASWVYSLCSLNPSLYPLPDNPCQVSGYIVARQDISVKAGDFDGTVIAAGESVCAALAGDFFELPVWREKQCLPAIEVDYRSFVPWQSAEPGDVIAGFTTYYCDKQGKKHPKEREANILLGCARIDHAVLASGESFSFNALCGPYKKSNGYFLAPNISSDGEGYGGGVCQVSTTLYNALLTLPLRIEEWNVHRYSGVAYVPQFFDAAVGRYTDLVFSNSLPYPLCIRASAENGIINVLIVCAQDDRNGSVDND